MLLTIYCNPFRVGLNCFDWQISCHHRERPCAVFWKQSIVERYSATLNPMLSSVWDSPQFIWAFQFNQLFAVSVEIVLYPSIHCFAANCLSVGGRVDSVYTQMHFIRDRYDSPTCNCHPHTTQHYFTMESGFVLTLQLLTDNSLSSWALWLFLHLSLHNHPTELIFFWFTFVYYTQCKHWFAKKSQS